MSATCPENREKVELQITEELKMGNYIITDHKPKIISAIGAIPKKDSDEIRIIHDASRPVGKNLNSYVDYDHCQYTSIDEVTSLLKPNGWMAKVDLRHAYRSVPISQDSWSGTGLKWKFSDTNRPTYMYDTRLPFGASPSPGIFQKLTKSVTRMLKRRGFKAICVYIDDFIIIADTYSECLAAFKELLSILLKLGFSISWRKVVPPTQCLTFLGIEINSIKETISMPSDKLSSLKDDIVTWIDRKKATKREMQQLIGKLNWATKVIRASRPFVRRLIDLMCTMKKSFHRVRLTAGVRDDLKWLAATCVEFNGTAVWLSKPPEPKHAMSTDASMSGGAAFLEGKWFYVNWEQDYPEMADKHINLKELYTVLLAVRKWYKLFKNKLILLEIDNMMCVYCLKKGSSKNPLATKFIREIYTISALNNFAFSVRYIKSKDNVMADALSRLDNCEFIYSAAELLLNWDMLILLPDYNLSDNMSDSAISLFLQVSQQLRWDIWTRISQNTEVQYSQNQPKTLTLHS